MPVRAPGGGRCVRAGPASPAGPRSANARAGSRNPACPAARHPSTPQAAADEYPDGPRTPVFWAFCARTPAGRTRRKANRTILEAYRTILEASRIVLEAYTTIPEAYRTILEAHRMMAQARRMIARAHTAAAEAPIATARAAPRPPRRSRARPRVRHDRASPHATPIFQLAQAPPPARLAARPEAEYDARTPRPESNDAVRSDRGHRSPAATAWFGRVRERSTGAGVPA
jgi:hypothetical protein